MPSIISCRVASLSCCSARGADDVRAVSRPLDRDVDLNDIARGDGYLFVRDGVGVAGRGVAARVPIDDVACVPGRASSTTTKPMARCRWRSASCRSSPGHRAS